jgi:hypothetical protein
VRVVRSRRRRLLGGLLVAAAGTLLATQSAFAAVDWGKVRQVSPAFSYNFGTSLARSTKDTASYLHATYTSLRIGGEFITDDGPFAGVYYRRGNSSGSDWGTAKRLNPTSSHADDGVVIASGRNVYAAYVTYGHYIEYDPAEPRPITVRTNGSYGAASAWKARKFTFGNRVDRPTMVPWGTRGFLMTYTDADTGNIVFVQCPDLTIKEIGCVGGNVGTTTVGEGTENGYAGWPVIAASGDTAAVAWFDGTNGLVVSTREGDGDWSEPEILTANESWDASAAAKGARFAFAWVESDGVKVRLWTSAGGLDDTSTAAELASDATYKSAYSTAVALAGTDTVGVAFGGCREADCSGGSSTGVDLRWVQSGNDASTWGAASTVASYSVSSARRMNDYPSVVMTSASKRYVMYNAANPDFTQYRVLLRVGTS